MQFDVAVIGGGPGGYVAALRAAQAGLNVCLVEKKDIGGTCLNVGCIPTKYLLSNSQKYAILFEYSDIGIEIEKIDFDFEKMIKGKQKVVQKLTGGVEFLLKKNRVKVIRGEASFKDSNTIQVAKKDGEDVVTASNIIVATGSKPLIPQVFGYDGRLVCSSTEALDWTSVPDSLLIVGGGVIGCELATIYANLGTEVTIVEMQDRILPTIDKELGSFAKSHLERKGVQIFTQMKVESITKRGVSAAVSLSDGSEIEVDKVVVSIGRSAELDTLNISAAGIIADKGKIVVDSAMRTNEKNIYAIGDVCSSPFDLAHSAMKEAIIAVENITGNNCEMSHDAIPSCVYSFPEIATVGLTQQDAEDQGIETMIGRFNFAANGKAISMGEAEGFIKIIADKKTQIIIGSQMAGPHVTDLIAQMAIVIENKMLASQITETVYPHPTLSEAIWEAAESVYGSAIHS